MRSKVALTPETGRKSHLGPLPLLVILSVLGFPSYVHADATADAGIKGKGFGWDSDLVTDSWLAGAMAGAAVARAATYQFESDLTADGASPAVNPELSPVPAGDKFGPNDANGIPTSKDWPPWFKPFTGPAGTEAATSLSGRTLVDGTHPWAAYDVRYSAAAVVVPPEHGGSGTAIGKVHDPLEFEFLEDTGDPNIHHLLAFRLDFDGASLTPDNQATSSSTKMTINADFVMITMEVAGGGSAAFSGTATIGADWRAFINVPFDPNVIAMPIPPEATASEIETLLASGYDPMTNVWSWSGPGMEITFTKDVGSGPSIQTMTVDIEAESNAARVTIPTLSEWALIIMTLLLLTAGTVVFGRLRQRRPATA